MTSQIRTYSELIAIPTFMERFKYLELNGQVGSDTFGFDRWLNQQFYHSKEWKDVRRFVILRDSDNDHVLDLAHPDYPLNDLVIVHHMNPITITNLNQYEIEWLLNPEYLICCSHPTHNAIHYGDEIFIKEKEVIERRPNDTCPWKGGIR